MKTIEEIAVIAAARYDNPFDEPAYDKKFYDGFVAGANYIMSLPLSERITAEEQKWIKNSHNQELEFAQLYKMKAESCCNVQCPHGYEIARDLAKSRAMLLESIFGKDMFK